MLCFTPRKPTSAWSRPNTQRIDRLRAEGLMLPAGEAVIAEEGTRAAQWNPVGRS